MSSTANRVIKNSGYLYANMGFSMFVSLYSTRLILNALGTSDFGIFAIVGGAIGMLGFIGGAMNVSTQRFINYAEGANKKETQKSIFNISIIIHSILSFIFLIVLEIAFYIFFNNILNIPQERVYAAKCIYQFMVLSTIMTILTVPYNAIVTAHENMLYYAKIGFLQTFLKLCIALFITYTMYDKLIMYGLLMAILSITVMIIMRIYCQRKYEECIINPRKYIDKQLMKKMIKFAGWNMITTSSSMISMYGMGLILNNIFGTILNAAQGIANQISGQLMVFSNTMLSAINPIIGKKAGEGNYKSLVETAQTTSKMSSLLLAFFAIPFIIEAPWIMQIWLKNVPEWAILFCRLEILRNIIDQLVNGINGAINADGRIHRYSIFRSIFNFIPLPITFYLFSIGFSPIWLYIVWIICWSILGGSVTIFFCHKNCGLNIYEYYKNVLLKSVTLFLIVGSSGLIPHYIMHSSLTRTISVCLTTSIAFLFSFWTIAITPKERNDLKNVLSTFRKKIYQKYK